MNEQTQYPPLAELVWLSPRQLEYYYDIKVGNQKHMRTANRLTYSKVGNYIRYKKSDIESMLASLKVEV